MAPKFEPNNAGHFGPLGLGPFLPLLKNSVVLPQLEIAILVSDRN